MLPAVEKMARQETGEKAGVLALVKMVH